MPREDGIEQQDGQPRKVQQGDFLHQRMLLEAGQQVTVSGSNGRVYTLQKKEGFYSCTCPLWRYQAVDGVPKDKRRCV